MLYKKEPKEHYSDMLRSNLCSMTYWPGDLSVLLIIS